MREEKEQLGTKNDPKPYEVGIRQLKASTSMRLPGRAGMWTVEHARLTDDACLLEKNFQMMLQACE